MSVDRAPSGKWRARWRDDHGVQRSRSFDRKLDAQRHETKMVEAVERGTYLNPTAGALSLEAWAVEWLTGAMNLGQGGRDTYRRDLDRYVLPALGAVPLRRITPAAIDSFLRSELDRQPEPLAPSTVHRHYRTLRRMLAVAVERGRIARNPCDPVTPPRMPQHEMRFLDAAEVERLAGAIGERYRAWVYVATYAGLRWSETVGLRPSDVDGNRLTVAGQLIRRADKQWHRDPPKTRAGRRVITLPDFLADLLAVHIEAWSTDGLVFPNRAGNPMARSNFSDKFKPALRRAGLDDLRIHDLRHTAVALAISAGAHPKAIQSRMGHASISITLDRYGHLFADIDEQLAVKLDAIRSAVTEPIIL